MTDRLKKDFKKAGRNEPDMPVISVKDGIANPAYIKLRAPLKRKWATLPLDVKKTLAHEIQRLKAINPTDDDFNKTLDYVGLVLALSWENAPAKKINLKTAERKLNATHAGLGNVKEKYIELIALMNSSGKSGNVICLAGPPGVGKTSIAKSMAAAMGRKCEKISMAGISDQTLLRGHNRTYVGARPGVIIQAMKNAGMANPVIILDEGDKIGENSSSGNPAYALLELLDPHQNDSFKDHYLNLEYDMSDVTFIITANDLSMLHPALIDRMEIISVDSYSTAEKADIAQNYLIPRHQKECGISTDQLTIDRSAIESLIEDYTQESGVRKLEQYIKTICRKTNTALQKGLADKAIITADNLPHLIGPGRVYKMFVPDENMTGCTTGLYFSDAGGGILPVQVTQSPSEKMQLSITGLPGQMTKESVQNAVEMIKANAERYGLSQQILNKTHIHMHLPDGASPKDGPSAGTASATAIISCLTGIKARREIAMTGEVDLYGNVLPIGGVKQKLEGARKAGATTVLIPAQNEPDLYDVPLALKQALRIIPVKHMDEVLQYALTELPFKPALHMAAAANPLPAPPLQQEIDRAAHLMAEHPEIMAQALNKLAMNRNKGPA